MEDYNYEPSDLEICFMENLDAAGIQVKNLGTLTVIPIAMEDDTFVCSVEARNWWINGTLEDFFDIALHSVKSIIGDEEPGNWRLSSRELNGG